MVTQGHLALPSFIHRDWNSKEPTLFLKVGNAGLPAIMPPPNIRVCFLLPHINGRLHRAGDQQTPLSGFDEMVGSTEGPRYILHDRIRKLGFGTKKTQKKQELISA